MHVYGLELVHSALLVGRASIQKLGGIQQEILGTTICSHRDSCNINGLVFCWDRHNWAVDGASYPTAFESKVNEEGQSNRHVAYYLFSPLRQMPLHRKGIGG